MLIHLQYVKSQGLVICAHSRDEHVKLFLCCTCTIQWCTVQYSTVPAQCISIARCLDLLRTRSPHLLRTIDAKILASF